MRHTKVNRDQNHLEIVAGLTTEGYSVFDLAAVGGGMADIIVGITDKAGKRTNLLIEIKANLNAKKQPDQIAFRNSWRGQYSIVFSLADALTLCAWYADRK